MEAEALPQACAAEVKGLADEVGQAGPRLPASPGRLDDVHPVPHQMHEAGVRVHSVDEGHSQGVGRGFFDQEGGVGGTLCELLKRLPDAPGRRVCAGGAREGVVRVVLVSPFPDGRHAVRYHGGVGGGSEEAAQELGPGPRRAEDEDGARRRHGAKGCGPLRAGK